MGTPDTSPIKVTNLRRSQRVCLSVPIIVVKGELGKSQATEETRTLIVSAHGALIVLKLAVQPGELLTVKHRKTQEELVCRVINHGPDQSGKREVGVEFEHPAPRFWRIAFPPSDWSPRSPDAKAPTAHQPGGRPPQRRPLVSPAEPERKQAAKQPGAAPQTNP